jgi:hypothetical protein
MRHASSSVREIIRTTVIPGIFRHSHARNAREYFQTRSGTPASGMRDKMARHLSKQGTICGFGIRTSQSGHFEAPCRSLLT